MACDANSAPVGMIRGEVEVQFVLAVDGLADTTTIAVQRTSKISTLTANSASRRLLPTCRFTPGEMNQRAVATVVSLRIELDRLEIKVKDGRIPPTANVPATSAPSPRSTSGDSVFHESDRRVEEKPVRFRCPQPVAQSYARAPMRAMGDLLDYSSRSRGPVRVAMIIGVDGRVVPGSVG